MAHIANIQRSRSWFLDILDLYSVFCSVRTGFTVYLLNNSEKFFILVDYLQFRIFPCSRCTMMTLYFRVHDDDLIVLVMCDVLCAFVVCCYVTLV